MINFLDNQNISKVINLYFLMYHCTIRIIIKICIYTECCNVMFLRLLKWVRIFYSNGFVFRCVFLLCIHLCFPFLLLLCCVGLSFLKHTHRQCHTHTQTFNSSLHIQTLQSIDIHSKSHTSVKFQLKTLDTTVSRRHRHS